jgi:hypothetical protein
MGVSEVYSKTEEHGEWKGFRKRKSEFLCPLLLTKSNNWLILQFLPRIVSLILLEDEEELQQKDILSNNMKLRNWCVKEFVTLKH